MSFQEFINQIVKSYCYMANAEYLHISNAARETLFNSYRKGTRLSPVFCLNGNYQYSEMKLVGGTMFSQDSSIIATFTIQDGILFFNN